jgi:hypothetical protein
VVWCASFQAAWKRLQHDLVKEPVRLDGAETLVEALNEAPDPAADIPEKWLYAAAGLTEDGIVERIQREMAERFPDKEPDIGIADGLLAYAYLSAALNFPKPYFQNDEPLLFTDSSGRRTPISSFGIREKDDHAYHHLRFQTAVLFAGLNDGGHPEFALDLWRDSEPAQLVVACVQPQETLVETVQLVEKRIPDGVKKVLAGQATADDSIIDATYMGGTGVILVPDMDWRLEHVFSELCGKAFVNTGIELPPIDMAMQDIEFKLSRSGVQLTSEAKLLTLGIEDRVVCLLDRPFLLYMKLRRSERPFLAMWVDNAELLKPFSAEDALAAQSAAEDAMAAKSAAEDALAAQSTAEDAWLRAQEIFERVESIVGPEASPDPQAAEAFRIYKEWCGQARRDHENGRLYQDVIDDLQWSADRLIKIHRGEWPEPQPPAEPPTPEPTPAPVIDEKAQPAGGMLGRLFDRLRGK